MLTLRMIDTRGRPLARRRLHIQLLGVPSRPAMGDAVKTDAEGCVRIRIPQGATGVYVNPPSVLGGKPFPFPVRLPLAPDTQELLCRFYDRVELTIVVRTPDGKTPRINWRHVQLTLHDPDSGQPLGNADGADGHSSPRPVKGGVRLSIPARPVLLRVTGYDELWSGEVKLQGTQGEQAVLELRPAADTHDVVFEFRDEAGKPVVGIQVMIRPMTSISSIDGATDAQGRLAARLHKGAYDSTWVIVRDGRWVLADEAGTIDFNVPAPGPIVIQLKRHE
jgi:hypothetical protein